MLVIFFGMGLMAEKANLGPEGFRSESTSCQVTTTARRMALNWRRHRSCIAILAKHFAFIFAKL